MTSLHARGLAVLLALPLLASCAPAQSGASASGSPATPGDGVFRVEYEEPNSPQTRQVRDELKQSGVIDDYAKLMTDFVRVPRDVTIRVKNCDEPNAYYVQEDHAIDYCYELPMDEKKLFLESGVSREELDDLVSRSAAGMLFHEGGHALIGELDLKTTGREEDVADQMSAYMLTSDEESAESLLAIAETYRLQAEKITAIEDLPYFDTHSLDQQRMVNFLCYAYGAYPDKFQDLVQEDVLPQERADGCGEEYAKMADAWGSLLEPYRK